MHMLVSIFVAFSALFCSSAVLADSTDGVLRFKSDKKQLELAKAESVKNGLLAARYVLNPNEKLVAVCSDNQELISASCEAVVPRAFGDDNFTHTIVTRTQIDLPPFW